MLVGLFFTEWILSEKSFEDLIVKVNNKTPKKQKRSIVMLQEKFDYLFIKHDMFRYFEPNNSNCLFSLSRYYDKCA